MPEIRPFRGVLYNQERVPLASCVAPPYDVISPQLQEELYERHPANIVRLILGRETDRYASAAATYAAWKASGILVQDQAPAIYVVSQDFSLPGSPAAVRTGFIAACRLEDFGTESIFPHEKTLSHPKEDRFRLFQATQAMFSQIFSIYGDVDHHIERTLEETTRTRPIAEVEQEGVVTMLWRLTDSAAIASIVRAMDRTKVFVADGHHRYETALLYRDAMTLRNPAHEGRKAYDFVPMYFTNMDAPGLVVLPTHRVVHGLPRFDPQSLLASLTAWFGVERRESPETLLGDLRKASTTAFGLVLGREVDCYLLSLRDPLALQHAGVSPVLAALDVTVLHSLVFGSVLGMSEEDQVKKRYLEYVKEPQSSLRAVRDGTAQALFLMNATPVQQVRAVAEAGLTMPQKSTYFFPKLLSGTVIYAFTEG